MAFGQGGTVSFNELVVTTFNNIHKTWVDNIFKARPLGYYLMREDRIQRVGGGVKLQEQIIGKTNGNVKWYSGTEQLAVEKTEEVTAALFDWRQLSVAVTIDGLEEAINSGQEQIADLLQVKIDVARESAAAELNSVFYGDGTGTSGKEMNGLGNLVGQNATAVGGIDPSDGDNAWWQSNIFDATDLATFGHTTKADLDVQMMARAYNTASVGSDTPKFVLTTQDLYESYESLLQPNMRYTNADVADAGFEFVEFKGKPVFYDEDCPAKTMYFINPKYLRLKVHKDRFFKAGPFIQPRDYDLRTMKVLTYGNLCISSRRSQAVITGVEVAGANVNAT